MVTAEQFTQLIGSIIKSCGLLEWQINHFIKTFSKDPILLKHILKLPLARRIEVLRDLMLEQSELKTEEVKSLCQELKEIAKDRNVVAHSPVTTGVKGSHIADDSNSKKFTEADLEALHKRTRRTHGKLIALLRHVYQ